MKTGLAEIVNHMHIPRYLFFFAGFATLVAYGVPNAFGGKLCATNCGF